MFSNVEGSYDTRKSEEVIPWDKNCEEEHSLQFSYSLVFM